MKTYGTETMIHENCCRVCLKQTSSRGLPASQFANLYNFVTNFEMRDSDIPQKMCRICVSLLNSAQDVILAAQRTEEMLKQVFELEIKEEPLDIKEEPYFEEVCSIPTESLEEKPATDPPMMAEVKTAETPKISKIRVSDETPEPTEFRAAKKKNRLKEKDTGDQVCDICGAVFPAGVRFQTHYKRHLVSREKTFSCDLCQGKKSFSNKKAVLWHMRRIHIRNKETCQHCGKVFTCRQNLKGHIQRNHTDTATWKYECQVCDRRFVIPSKLKEHMKQHTDQRDHSCPICKSKFLRAAHVRKHILYKHNTGSFECPHCSKVFASSMYLTQHLKTHIQGGYVCPMCPGKGFSLSTTLRSHIKNNHPSLELPPPGTVLKNFDWSKVIGVSGVQEVSSFIQNQ